MIGEEESSSKQIEAYAKSQLITDSRDLRVRRGVAKEDDEGPELSQTSETVPQVDAGVRNMAGDEEPEGFDETDDS